MRPHEVCLHFGLLDFVPKSGNQRRKIMDFIYSLREHPDTRGDFTDKVPRSENARSRSSATTPSHSGSIHRSTS